MARASALPVSGPQLDNRRVLAALIDIGVILVGALVIGIAAGASGASEFPASLDAILLGWALYYYFACESSESGQTLGKRAMNIRVVRVDGSPAGMREVAVRTILRVIDGIFFYLVGLIVMIATGERRGRLGDLAAGTKVVSADVPARAPVVAAVAAEPQAPRVPIAESGPAFAEPAEAETVDTESASLKELAADVEATAGSAPDEDPALQPVPDPEPTDDEPADDELAPAAEADEEPVAEEAEPVTEPEAEAEPEPVVEIAEPELEPQAEAELEEPVVEIAEPEPEPDVEAAEPVAEADEADEPEDDPLAGASDDELDEAEIAAAVEAELDGEPARKPRARAKR
jgi:uncharacterized RDD family membrane protein YckC